MISVLEFAKKIYKFLKRERVIFVFRSFDVNFVEHAYMYLLPLIIIIEHDIEDAISILI